MAGAVAWRSSCENEVASSTSLIAGRRRTTTRNRSSADTPRGEGSCLSDRRLNGGLGNFVGVALRRLFGLDARGVMLRFGEAARTPALVAKLAQLAISAFLSLPTMYP